MKKLNKLLVLFLIFILTGCSGNYDVNINKDLSVEESLYLSLDNDENVYNKTIKIFDDNKIDRDKYNVKQSSNEIIIEYKEKYNSVDEYILKSKIYHQLIDDISYNKNQKYVDIYIDQYVKIQNQNESSLLGNVSDINFLQINIKTPFKVLVSNADNISEDTYTWTIDKNTVRKKILFQFSKRLNRISYPQIAMLTILIMCMVILIVRLIKKYQKSQKI